MTDAASRGIEVLIENGRLSPALIHFTTAMPSRIQAKQKLPLNQWTHVGLTYMMDRVGQTALKLFEKWKTGKYGSDKGPPDAENHRW